MDARPVTLFHPDPDRLEALTGLVRRSLQTRDLGDLRRDNRFLYGGTLVLCAVLSCVYLWHAPGLNTMAMFIFLGAFAALSLGISQSVHAVDRLYSNDTRDDLRLASFAGHDVVHGVLAGSRPGLTWRRYLAMSSIGTVLVWAIILAKMSDDGPELPLKLVIAALWSILVPIPHYLLLRLGHRVGLHFALRWRGAPPLLSELYSHLFFILFGIACFAGFIISTVIIAAGPALFGCFFVLKLWWRLLRACWNKLRGGLLRHWKGQIGLMMLFLFATPLAIVAGVAMGTVVPFGLVLGWIAFQLTMTRRLLIRATKYWETETEFEPVFA